MVEQLGVAQLSKSQVSEMAHGLVSAVGAPLPGATWQRCRTPYLGNLLSKVPKSAQPWVATLVRTVFDQPDADAVHAQFHRVVQTIEQRFPAAAEHPDAARDYPRSLSAASRSVSAASRRC